MEKVSAASLLFFCPVFPPQALDKTGFFPIQKISFDLNIIKLYVFLDIIICCASFFNTIYAKNVVYATYFTKMWRNSDTASLDSKV